MRHYIQTHAVVGLGKKILAALQGGVLVLGLMGGFLALSHAYTTQSPNPVELVNGDDIKRG